ncbi:hypothetical protein WMF41_51555 [Sorangium sp. So ce1151]
MIGQDAVKTARGFNERLSISGVVLTKLDGDARGGAALSIKEVTGAPVLFSGVGETLDKFEPFRADGMASRILGMGDVVGLMQDFEEVVDQKKAEKDAARMLQGDFTLEDFLDQVRMIHVTNRRFRSTRPSASQDAGTIAATITKAVRATSRTRRASGCRAIELARGPGMRMARLAIMAKVASAERLGHGKHCRGSLHDPRRQPSSPFSVEPWHGECLESRYVDLE